MDRRKQPAQAPDGQQVSPRSDGDGTRKSRVSETQDPLISGDAEKPEADTGSGGATVDEAGQIKPAGDPLDLLH